MYELKPDVKLDVEEGLFINGERCRRDTLAQCSPNGGNILVTYDTSPIRSRSPETLSSSSDSDVIILGNEVDRRGLAWCKSREAEFTMNLRGLKTPSPTEIVAQWLQASPTYKTLAKSPTIVVERTVEDKEESVSRPESPSRFEIFDLGANRLNTTSPPENPLGSGTSPNPMSPETRRKQELCSYLQLMNMNSKSDKQRSKIRPNFNRRSNRVKNLIVQIEKRKLEEKINKEIDSNSFQSTKLIHQLFNLRRKSIMNGHIIQIPETSESVTILQGFTPCLMPVKIRKRRVAFDIVMRRFITDEAIAAKRRDPVNSGAELSNITSATKQKAHSMKRRSSTIISDGERSVNTTITTLAKRGRRKVNKEDNRSNKAIKDRRSTIADDAQSVYTTRSKSKVKIAKDFDKKHKSNEDVSILKRGRPKITEKPTKRLCSPVIADCTRSDKKTAEAPTTKVKTAFNTVKLKKVKTVTHKRRNEKRLHRVMSLTHDLTLFEKEIVKIARLSRSNSRSQLHNLRIRKNRLKHKENLPNKNRNKTNNAKINSLVKNVLKAKQGRSIEHKNNGTKIKLDKTVNEVEIHVSSRKNKENTVVKKNGLQLKLLGEKEIEIVDLSANSSKVTKTPIKAQNLDLNQVGTVPIGEEEPSSPININLYDVQHEFQEYCNKLWDHTYAQSADQDNSQELRETEMKPDFYGFTSDEQSVGTTILQLLSEIAKNRSEINRESTPKVSTSIAAIRQLKVGTKSTLEVNNSSDTANTQSLPSSFELEQTCRVEPIEELNLENSIVVIADIEEKNNSTADIVNLDLNDELIRYNMHDYYVPEKLDNHSEISDNNSSSINEDSSDNSSVYSDSSKKSKLLIQLDTLENESKEKQSDLEGSCSTTKMHIEKETEITSNNLVDQTESPLQSTHENIRSVTPPTFIPFLAQNLTPSRTLHRNLTNNNNCIRRKVPVLPNQSPSANIDSTSSSSKTPTSNHCAMLDASNGRLVHAEYCAGQLVASQESLVTCWAQTPLGHILHSQEFWIARGVVTRQQFGEDSVLKNMKNRLMIVDNVISYVEIWVKEHKSVFRERPVADVFAVLYSWKPNQTVEKKLIQLENIKGSADDVQCIILKKSRSVLVSWSIMQSTIKQATVLQLYELSPDYQRIQTVKELKSIGTKIQSLHTIEDSDDLVIGCGENCINIWNIEYGYIVATLDIPDTLPEPKCLWTLCNQGFVFLLQECNDGLLRLIAINGMKMKITWKNLKIFNPPKEYYNLLGVCLENGILIACYENGILSWNVQTSELLTEEPLPMEENASFSPPSCFLSDSHLVQLERNGQIQVRHVLYHLLTSSDLSM